MLEGYITASKDTPSRSGFYANQLPGVSLALFTSLTKDEQEDWEEFYSDIYERTVINFTGDVQSRLADKFFIDLKLVSRETSKFSDDLNESGLTSGVKIQYRLPKYGKTQVVYLEVFSDSFQFNFSIEFRDKDANGRLLKTVQADLVEGINIINIDTYFTVDELFIGYDASAFDIRGTINKYYDDYFQGYTDWECWFPCYGTTKGSVSQINGGGFNVIFDSVCSIEKVIEQNINIFKEALWYRLGLELIRECIHTDKISRFTTLSSERAQALQRSYMDECEIKLSNSIRSLRMKEDTVCFSCKSLVKQSYQLP